MNEFSVQFPYKISRKAESFIKSLCRQDPSERVGYQRAGVADIRKHRWFQVWLVFNTIVLEITCRMLTFLQGFDWDALRNESLEAKHKPVIKNQQDISNFEKIHEEDPSRIPEESSGWDKDF